MKQFFISQKNLERPNTIIIGSNCKGGQKRQDLSTDISKRGNPPRNYVEFWAKWVEIIPFWGATLLRGWRDSFQAVHKMVIRSRVVFNNYLEKFFPAFPSCFDLHCSLPKIAWKQALWLE